MKPRKPSFDLDAMLEPEPTAKWLGMSKRKLLLWVAQGKIPCLRIGERVIRFHPRTILATQENLPLPVLQRLKQGVI